MKKFINYGLCTVFLALLLASSCYAKDLLITANYPDYSEMSLQVLDYNSFHDDDYIIGDIFTDHNIILLDSKGAFLYEGPLGDTVTIFQFDDRIKKVVIQDSSTNVPLASKDISFCNHDGFCDSCDGPDCDLMENYLTCPDCPSGSNDGFCDQILDGFCDPDCENQEYDCPSCEPFCVFASASCDDLGGELCETDVGCVDGYLTQGLLDDGSRIENCCVNGLCGNAAEELEIQKQMSYYPENFNIADDESIPVGTCSDRNGVLCDYGQDCDGEWNFNQDGEEEEDGICCQGTCITPDDLLLGEPGSESRFQGPDKPSQQEQLELLGPQDQFRLPRELPPGVEEDLTEEELELYRAGEIIFSTDGSVYVGTEENIDPDTIAFDQEIVDQKADELEIFLAETEEEDLLIEKQEREEKIKEYTLGFSPLTFFVTIGVVMILIVSSILYFRFKSKTSQATSTNDNINLQAQIDSLLDQKLNYTQIQSKLIEKGYSSDIVNAEIKKNYYKKKNKQDIK